MQLANVKISNLISFPYVANLAKEKGIAFSHTGKWGVNILIWPNGSGKSSFLEIINQIFKVGLMRDYIYNKHLLGFENQLDSVIVEHKMHLKNLEKNFESPDKNSRVHMTLILHKNDYDNLGFLCKYAKEINSIIKKYSSLNVQFSCIDFDKLLEHDHMKFHFLIDVKNEKIILDTKHLTSEQKFILNYIINQELVQICMNIYNDIEKKDNERERYPLKNTFAILGSHRNFGDIIHDDSRLAHISPKKWSMYITGQNTKTYYSISIGYYLCMMKLWEVIDSMQEKTKEFQNNDFSDLYKQIYKNELKQSDFYVRLNALIQKYLWMSLVVKYENGDFIFLLEWEFGYRYHFNQLSSGDQSFLMIILTVYGYDLESGLMIIDEPELHLHPQMQKKFIEFINEVSDEFHLQIIFATHSPLMITEENIRRVYRFSKTNLKTRIVHPALKIRADESDLVHMLKFENIAKIFFVDKILLVEWATDVYFVDYYLQYLKKLPEWQDRIGDYEILNIHGKWSYRRWARFLGKFGIEAYFIGDWDNIVDQKIITDMEMQHYRKKAKKYYRFLKSTKRHIPKRHYGLLVDMIESYYPNEYKYIIEQIEGLYQQNVFLFKKWDLETYLWTRAKGLDETIVFCHNHFLERFAESRYADRREELESIFGQIFV